jgi:hypothetical protein
MNTLFQSLSKSELKLQPTLKNFIFAAENQRIDIMQYLIYGGFDLRKYYEDVIENIVTCDDIETKSTLDFFDTTTDLSYTRLFDSALNVLAYKTVCWSVQMLESTDQLDHDISSEIVNKILSQTNDNFEKLVRALGYNFIHKNINLILKQAIDNNFKQIVTRLCGIAIDSKFNNKALKLCLEAAIPRLNLIQYFIEVLRCDSSIWYEWISKHPSHKIRLYLLKTKYNISAADFKILISKSK